MLDKQNIIDQFKPYINADIALAYCSFLKMVELGYSMPDRIILMWATEMDRVRKLTKSNINAEMAIEISPQLAFKFWGEIDIGEQFRLLQNAQQMVKFGRI